METANRGIGKKSSRKVEENEASKELDWLVGCLVS